MEIRSSKYEIRNSKYEIRKIPSTNSHEFARKKYVQATNRLLFVIIRENEWTKEKRVQRAYPIRAHSCQLVDKKSRRESVSTELSDRLFLPPELKI